MQVISCMIIFVQKRESIFRKRFQRISHNLSCSLYFRAEYKIPGLYVIDSIVRQSRHQFGPDKDVFAPRFAKNIQLTFYHLYKCSEEEKVRIDTKS